MAAPSVKSSIPIVIFLVLCSLELGHPFGWTPPNETHRTITENGLTMALRRHYKANPTLIACAQAADSFQQALEDLMEGNIYTDSEYDMYWTAHYHFDAELFQEAFDNLADRRKRAREAVKAGNFTEARFQVGVALHAVQDFYAHSNWVEMGKKAPSLGTLGRIMNFGVPLADKDTVTCTACADPDGCTGNVYTDKLTTGYFKGELDPNGKEVSKPEWKCSHGGFSDPGKEDKPVGGINKDGETTSPHGDMHKQAARLASMASAHFLVDFGYDIGKAQFEKLMGIEKVADNCVDPLFPRQKRESLLNLLIRRTTEEETQERRRVYRNARLDQILERQVHRCS